jgi:MoaA/NifB/PqqE/SkfB family radical SAM enzyme
MKRRNFICCVSSLLLTAIGIKYLKKLDIEQEDFNTAENSDLFFKYVEIHLADHCNLNCKYCSHFSSIADKKFYDLHKFTKDIARLSKITGKNIKKISLLGGEPLLNPKVCEYMSITRQYFPQTAIRLLTNGTLLSSQNNYFWENLSKNDIKLTISSYPIDINREVIEKKAAEFDVKMQYFYFKDEFEKLNLDLSGSQKDMFSCQKCFTGGCYNLYEGKLYACPVIAFVKYFNKKFNKNIKVSGGDYIDIYKINSLNEIIKWTYEPKKFCKYCTPTTSKPWEMSNEHNIAEWVSEII